MYICLPFFFSEVVISMYLFLLKYFSNVQFLHFCFRMSEKPNSTSKGFFGEKPTDDKNHRGPAGNETVKISAQPVVMKNVSRRQMDFFQKMIDGYVDRLFI